MASMNQLAEAIAHLKATDPRIAQIIVSVGPFSIKIRKDPFCSLAEAIISQQLASAAAATIYSRFLKIYGGSPSPIAVLRTNKEKLRNAGISARKIEYLRDLAANITNASLDPAALKLLGDKEVIEKLTTIKGIGRWTAEMFLIFCLERLDVLPVGDLGLRKAVQQV